MVYHAAYVLFLGVCISWNDIDPVGDITDKKGEHKTIIDVHHRNMLSKGTEGALHTM